MTIWKYALALKVEQNISMPEGAQILTAQMQGEQLCLWALVDPQAPKQRRVIEVHGTGRYIQFVHLSERKYIATVQIGSYAWHVFELV